MASNALYDLAERFPDEIGEEGGVEELVRLVCHGGDEVRECALNALVPLTRNHKDNQERFKAAGGLEFVQTWHEGEANSMGYRALASENSAQFSEDSITSPSNMLEVGSAASAVGMGRSEEEENVEEGMRSVSSPTRSATPMASHSCGRLRHGSGAESDSSLFRANVDSVSDLDDGLDLDPQDRCGFSTGSDDEGDECSEDHERDRATYVTHELCRHHSQSEIEGTSSPSSDTPSISEANVEVDTNASIGVAPTPPEFCDHRPIDAVDEGASTQIELLMEDEGFDNQGVEEECMDVNDDGNCEEDNSLISSQATDQSYNRDNSLFAQTNENQRENDTSIQIEVEELAQRVKESPQMWRSLLHSRGLKTISTFLESEDERVLLDAVSIMATVVADDQSRDDFVEAVGIETVIRLFNQQFESASLQALSVCDQLIRHSVHRLSIVEANGVCHLTKFLQNGSEMQRMKAEGILKVLANLDESDKADSSKQILPAAIALIRCGTNCVRDEATKKLHAIIESESDFSGFCVSDTARALLCYLDEGNAKAQLEGVKILNELVGDSDILRQVVCSKVSGINVYTKLLMRDEMPALQMAVIRVLPKMLLEQNRPATNTQRGAIDLIVRLMRVKQFIPRQSANSTKRSTRRIPPVNVVNVPNLALAIEAFKAIAMLLSKKSYGLEIVELNVSASITTVLKMELHHDDQTVTSTKNELILSLKREAMKVLRTTTTVWLFDFGTLAALLVELLGRNGGLQPDVFETLNVMLIRGQLTLDGKTLQTLITYVNFEDNDEVVGVINILQTLTSKTVMGRSTDTIDIIARSGAIPALIRLEQGSPVNLQQCATAALDEICKQTRLFAVAQSVRTVLALKMRPENTGDKVLELVELSTDATNRVAIVQVDGISMLIKLLDSAAENKVKESVFKILFVIARDQYHVHAFIETGGINVLSSILVSANGQFAEEAAVLLWKLGETTTHINVPVKLTQDAITELQNFRISDIVAPLNMLSDLAYGLRSSRWAREFHGAIKPLVQVVSTGDDLEKLLAAQALTGIAKFKENAAAIVKEQGVPPLVELVKHGNDSQKTHAASALAKLAKLEYAHAVISARGVQEAIKLLRSTVEDHQYTGAHVLVVVAEHQKYNLHSVFMANAQENLQWVIDNGSQRERKIASRAMRLLQLGSDDENEDPNERHSKRHKHR